MPRKKKEKVNLSLPAPIEPRERSIFEESDFSTTVRGTETLQPASTALATETQVVSTPDPIYSVIETIKEKKALPGVTVGTDIPFEPLTGLEDEIFKILSEDRVNSVKGIKGKLKGKFSNVTEEEIDVAVTSLISDGLVVEVSDGKFKVAEAEDEDIPTPTAKRKTGKAGKTFRNLFARTKVSGSTLMGKIGKGGRKVGIGVGTVGVGIGKGIGAKTPFVGGEARQTRAEESAFWEQRYEGAGVGALPPSMRKRGRKDIKSGFISQQELERQLDIEGIPRTERKNIPIYDEKKKKWVEGPTFQEVPKSRAKLRQDLLDHQIATERKGAEFHIGKSLHKQARGLDPGRLRSTAETAGRVGVIASKGGIALAKQFGTAPRIGRVTGLTGSDSPITYEGSGAGRLRAATVGFRPIGISSPRGEGRGSPMDPFPSRDRISPSGRRIPLFSTPGSGGRVSSVSRRGLGRPRSRPLF